MLIHRIDLDEFDKSSETSRWIHCQQCRFFDNHWHANRTIPRHFQLSRLVAVNLVNHFVRNYFSTVPTVVNRCIRTSYHPSNCSHFRKIQADKHIRKVNRHLDVSIDWGNWGLQQWLVEWLDGREDLVANLTSVDKSLLLRTDLLVNPMNPAPTRHLHFG